MGVNGNGNGAVLGKVGFFAEDVTNLAQIGAFVTQVCADAGHTPEGLNVAGILGDLAKRIAMHLPMEEQLRLERPPVDVKTA